VLNLSQVGENFQDHLLGHLKFAVNSRKYSINHILGSVPWLGVEMTKWVVAGKGVLATSTSHFSGFFRSNFNFARPDLQHAMRPFSVQATAQGASVPDTFPAVTMSAIQTRPFSRVTCVSCRAIRRGARGST
jgi:choline dehydrogenase-like flavoprotein